MEQILYGTDDIPAGGDSEERIPQSLEGEA